METRNATLYAGPDSTAAAPATPATMHASLEALEAVAGVRLVRFAEAGNRPVRCTLLPAGVGNDGTTVRTPVWLVLPTRLEGGGGTPGVRLAKLGDLTATLGADPVSVGGRANHVFAKSVSWTPTELAEAMSGGALKVGVFPASGGTPAAGGQGNPAGICVYDIGNAIGVLLSPALGTSSPATAAAMLVERWS